MRAHSEVVKLLVQFSRPLSARRILRERWLGLPTSSSAGVRGVFGARPLLSLVRAVSRPSADRPGRALFCRLLQHAPNQISTGDTSVPQATSVRHCCKTGAA